MEEIFIDWWWRNKLEQVEADHRRIGRRRRRRTAENSKRIKELEDETEALGAAVAVLSRILVEKGVCTRNELHELLTKEQAAADAAEGDAEGDREST